MFIYYALPSETWCRFIHTFWERPLDWLQGAIVKSVRFHTKKALSQYLQTIKARLYVAGCFAMRVKNKMYTCMLWYLKNCSFILPIKCAYLILRSMVIFTRLFWQSSEKMKTHCTKMLSLTRLSTFKKSMHLLLFAYLQWRLNRIEKILHLTYKFRWTMFNKCIHQKGIFLIVSKMHSHTTSKLPKFQVSLLKHV